MKYVIALVLTVLLVGCGGSNGSNGVGGALAAGTDATNGQNNQPVEVDHQYTFVVTGNGVQFAAVFTGELTNGSQSQLSVGPYIIPSASPVDYTVFGKNVIADIAKISGAGTLEITLYKDNVAIQHQQIVANGTSISITDGF